MAIKRYDIYFVTYDVAAQASKIAKGPYAQDSLATVGSLRRPNIYTVDPEELEATVDSTGWMGVLFYDQPAIVFPGDTSLTIDQIPELPAEALAYLGMAAS